MDHENQIRLVVGEYIDDNINASNPYEEWCNGDIIIMSKYDVGRMIVLENCEEDEWEEGEEVVDYEKLYNAISFWSNKLKEEILDNALEYIENNNIGLRC